MSTLTAVLDASVVIGLGALLIATAFPDAGHHSRTVRALHSIGLIPQWSFFAPIPGTQNLYLLYRDVHYGGDATPWRIVHHMDEDRGPWTFVWNPQRRLRKALHDLITGLPYDRYKSDPELFKLSTPYLLIVHHLSSLPRLRGAWAFEFLIMASEPYQSPKVAFHSELHRF